MQDKLIAKTAVFTAIFSILAMCLMIGFAVRRECVYVAAKEDIIELQKEQSELLQKINFTEEKEELLIIKEKNEIAHFTIPLPAAINETDMVIENSYGGNKLYITIAGIEKEFFKKHPLTTAGQYVSAAFYQYHRGVTKIELQLNKLYEHNALVKNSNLYFNFSNPSDLYEKIIVLDAGHGGKDTGDIVNGAEEKNIAMEICIKLANKLEQNGIKAYLTRNENKTVSNEDRINLPNQLRADMFISFHTAISENEDEFGVTTIYNKEYFIPTLGNIQLADFVERNIVKECKTQALGLKTSEKYEFLNQIIVPATIVEVGYLSNQTENIMLKEETYKDKIVDGVYNAIVEAYQLIE